MMKQIYFDNGASSYPKPRNVYENTYDFICSNGANVGRSSHKMAVEAAEVVYETRAALSRFFGMRDPEKVVFTMNATHALNTVLQGYLQKGDHVVTTVMEHNSVLRPLYAMQNRGVELSVADVDLYDDQKTLQNIKSLIRGNTKAIVVSQCSNVCGKMLPIKELSSLKNERIRLIIDGSQGAGSIPTDFEKMGMDYYCAPFHKGMLGLQGGGFALCRYNELSPLMFGGTGGESIRRDQPNYLPERLEAGTLPVPSIYSAREGIRFLERVGVETVFAHKKKLVRELYKNLSSLPRIEVCADYGLMQSPGVLSFTVKDSCSEEVGAYLAEKGVAVRAGLHCAPLFHKKMNTEDCGMVRVSFGFANTMEEIADFIEILKYF